MRIDLRLLFLVVLLWPCQLVLAQPKADFNADPSQNLRLEVGQTRLIRASEKVIRVSIADSNVSDVQVVTPRQVLITAKAVGYTHLILWDERDNPLVIAVSVTRNLDQLRSQYKELFPEERINVGAAGDLIVLSGTVADLRIPARAAEVAQLHSEKLANLIQVSGDQQVQLEVKFAEVSRTGMRKSGVNFLWQDNARGYVAGQATNTAAPGLYLNTETNWVPGTNGYAPPYIATPSSTDAFNLFFSTGLSDFPFSAILSILAQEGLAKVLAEPTLVALSGQEAEFHAGGEVPIVASSTLGNISITYKKFGVLLKFTPTVLSERTLSLKLGLEVSEPDASVGILASGFQIPGFKTRSSETTIRLKDGQSFAIAGLLSDSVRSISSKVPLLGSLPILGLLFSSKSYQRNETELMMVITAHLVKPLSPNQTPLMPGEDEYNDPSDFELFILGATGSDEFYSKKFTKPQQINAPAAQTVPDVESSTVHDKESFPEKNPKPEFQKSSPTAPPSDPYKQSKSKTLEGPLGPIGFIRG